jgi:hypothetical protein
MSKMGRSGELSDFERGLVIGCHINKKSVTDIATLLKVPKLMIGDVIVKWKLEGTTGYAAFNDQQGPLSLEKGGS